MQKRPTRLARWYWGLTFITSAVLTIVVNAAHAKGVLAVPGTWTAVAVAACPPSLFVILTEGYFLVRRVLPVSVQRVVVCSVGTLCVTAFAVSYETSRLFVNAVPGPLPSWVGWVIPGMLDLTVAVSTYVGFVLTVFSDAGVEARSKRSRSPRWARIGDNLLSRVEAASAAKPKPVSPVNAGAGAALDAANAVLNADASATSDAASLIRDDAANAAIDAANCTSNATPSAPVDAASDAASDAARAAGNAVLDAAETRSVNAAHATADAGTETLELAQRIRSAAGMRTPVDQIAAVLAADDAKPDLPAERVAADAGIKHHSTVARIRATRKQVADRPLAKVS